MKSVIKSAYLWLSIVICDAYDVFFKKYLVSTFICLILCKVFGDHLLLLLSYKLIFGVG